MGSIFAVPLFSLPGFSGFISYSSLVSSIQLEGEEGRVLNFLCAIRFCTRLLSSGSVISDQSSFFGFDFEEECFPLEEE